MKENITISEYFEDLSNILSNGINDLIDYEINKLQNNEKLDENDLLIIYRLLLLSKKN